tara:strand:+ start:263 stop:1033 length:771 start_codon:yes stop_codon:yes gene_type:complete
VFNILTSYPKSGNTWLRFIIYEIYFNVEDNNYNSKNVEIFVPDFHKLIKNNKLILDERLRNKKVFLKTHYDFFKMQNLNIDKIILLLRNPLDVLSSIINYYDIKNESLENVVNEFAEYHTLMNFKKNLNFPSYSEHLQSWVGSNKNILIINYDDLLNNFKKTVKELGIFLGESLDEKRIKIIEKNTSFDKLNNLEKYERKQSIDGFFTTSISNKNSFMNKGKSKNYENILNPNQIKKIKDSFSEIIEKYNLDSHKG